MTQPQGREDEPLVHLFAAIRTRVQHELDKAAMEAAINPTEAEWQALAYRVRQVGQQQ